MHELQWDYSFSPVTTQGKERKHTGK